jgi:uncharacterized protein (TIGR02266 family)
LADPNTRQGKRTPVTLKIKFKSETVEQFIDRYAVDVSQGGIFIRTKEPLAVGTQMRFEFQLRDASPLIAGEGTVVWTRENDPSRPAIAPGMGVRFDRLADGSQSVLERILSEKAKQAPQRGGEITKQPLFTDTPTRVAPAPVQEALLGSENKSARHKGPTGGEFETSTPLPKPMPFHTDADEFPDEAFEEATKVRALDDLIAQTAEDSGSSAAAQELFSGRPPSDELAARRSGGIRSDATLSDAPTANALATEMLQDPGGTAPGFASARASAPAVERDSAPVLPSPPEAPKQPRMLDTSPSPRTDESGPISTSKAALIAQNDRMEKLAKTKIGMEPAYVATRSPTASSPPINAPVARDAPTRPSGHAIAAELERPRPSASMDAAPRGSKAPLIILILLILAGGAAGVWFFVLRDKAVENNKVATPGSGSDKVGSDKPGSGSDTIATGPGSDKAGSAEKPPEPPKGPMVDIEITASSPKAQVEVVGTDIKGPVPLKAKLEKDKAYQVRVSAPGMATLEQEVKGGTDKWSAKLIAKPMVITVSSEPVGALILIDGVPVNHVTPFDVELTKAQAAKKNVRVGLRKAGFRPVEKMVDLGAFTEEDARMIGQLSEKLAVQQVVVRPPPTNGSGSGSGSASAGSGSGEGSGSATPPPNPGGGSDTTTPPPEPPKDPPKEPTPEFVNP